MESLYAKFSVQFMYSRNESVVMHDIVDKIHSIDVVLLIYTTCMAAVGDRCYCTRDLVLFIHCQLA